MKKKIILTIVGIFIALLLLAAGLAATIYFFNPFGEKST